MGLLATQVELGQKTPGLSVANAWIRWARREARKQEVSERMVPTHEDLESELRAIFGREAGEPLPDLSLFPPQLLEFESPPGTYFDAFPLLLLTSASLASMQERAPGSVFELELIDMWIVTADFGASILEQLDNT